MKALAWLALILLVYWALRSKRSGSSTKATPTASGHASGEKMVQCARCETYVPASEALTGPGGKSFCCEEHRRQAST